mgnify:CR=1 FL=1
MSRAQIVAVLKSLLGSLPFASLASMASAQAVPGFTVETFSSPPSPNLLAFGADGILMPAATTTRKAASHRSW